MRPASADQNQFATEDTELTEKIREFFTGGNKGNGAFKA